MSTTSPLLLLTLQDLDENPDTWGSVLNVSALQLLEDGIAGVAAAVLVSTADYTLTDTAGGPSATDSARYAIINATGSPGGTTNIVVPARSKIYVVANNTGDSSSIVPKTAAGTGPTVPPGVAQWVYCDGTNVIGIDAATATLATTATTANNALAVGGDPESDIARLDEAQTFTAGQVVQRVTLTDMAGDITPNLADSNSFFHLMLQGENLATPTNATNGQQFSLVLEQGVGAPHALTFQANTFIWEGGSAPTLSTAFGDIDYLAFEYVTNTALGNRWIGSIVKGIS